MEQMILGTTQGAVGSLLARLTCALAEEAQKLGSVRNDMQFIKDEMESMHGFLLHVAESNDGEEDHQIQAWMKQVAEVAYASQNCVDIYVQSLSTRGGERGLIGYLRRLPRLLWTLPTRHRIATQIRELKIRSREVGERRLRYGVEAPASRGHNRLLAAGDDGANKEGDEAQWGALAGVEPPLFASICLEDWIKVTEDDVKRRKHGIFPKVIALVGDAKKARQFAKVAFEDPWVASTCSLDCMAWIQLGAEYDPDQLPRDILKTLGAREDLLCLADDKKLLKNLESHLKGKRFFIVLENVQHTSLWSRIEPALNSDMCSLGSAMLVTTDDPIYALQFVPYDIYRVERLDTYHDMYSDAVTKFYLDKALAHMSTIDRLELVLRDIFMKLSRQTQNCKLFIHALYCNSDATQEDLQSLENRLKYLSPNNNKEVLRFLYKVLPSSCKNCLLSLGIFSDKTSFRRARFIRRWAAEGMITRQGRMTALDEAERCFHVLVSHGYLVPKDADVTGKVKSFVIHDVVAEIARDENSDIANLVPELSQKIPMRNAFQLQQAAQLQHEKPSKSRLRIWNYLKQSHQTETDESNATKIFLELFPLSSHLGLLEVLDLEKCPELKDHHLKNICINLFQLKYLSLRSTDITELPKQIDKLRYLETLDIRQTKVKAFAKNYVVLPKLKHLLAGHKADHTSQAGDIQSEEPFFTIQMPRGIGAMTELQVMSHVAVSGSGDELVSIGIGSLLRLRKLGVVLQRPQEPVFRHLYHAIGKLSRSLHTLSIQIVAENENRDTDMADEEFVNPPKYLQALEISGMVSGFPAWVKHLRELTKVTLHKTLLRVDDITILGKLTRLCYLRLWQESCIERTLTFSKDEFQGLKFLVIECSDMTTINFGDKATPKLKKLVWISSGSQSRSLTGIEKLLSLKVLKLAGNFNKEKLKVAIAANTNDLILEIEDASNTTGPILEIDNISNLEIDDASNTNDSILEIDDTSSLEIDDASNTTDPILEIDYAS